MAVALADSLGGLPTGRPENHHFNPLGSAMLCNRLLASAACYTIASSLATSILDPMSAPALFAWTFGPCLFDAYFDTRANASSRTLVGAGFPNPC